MGSRIIRRCIWAAFLLFTNIGWSAGSEQKIFSAAAEKGVRLQLGDKPTFINAAGEPFISKGIIYYQPNAAHHYFLRGLDISRVSADLRKFRDVGFNTICIDVGWGEIFDDVDPNNNYSPTRINYVNIEKLKALVSIARSECFYVYVSPGVQIVPPQVDAKHYKATTDTAGNYHPEFKGYLIHNWLVNPALNNGFVQFLEYMGKILRPYENIVAYSLYFELMEQQFPWCHKDEMLVSQWQKYLRDKNPDVNFWKKRWNEENQPYTTIDQIRLPYRDRDYWYGYYRDYLFMKPRESSVLAWRDCYDFMMVAVGYDGKYGLSFSEIAKAIRRGDTDAVIVWKANDVERYVWEMGCVNEFRAGTTPPDAMEILKKSYSYPGIDIIAVDGYPLVETDPNKRAFELSFERNIERAKMIKAVSPLPLYCQEFGINHYQWTPKECAQYLANAIKGYQCLNVLGYNLWQSYDYYTSGVSDDIQANFGIFDANGNPYPVIEKIRPLLIKKQSVKQCDDPAINGTKSVWDNYLDETRLVYHGYFFHEDVLEHKDELRKLRLYTNTIVCGMFFPEDAPNVDVNDLLAGKIDSFSENMFKKADERLEFLASLGFEIIAELPLQPMIAKDKPKELRQLLLAIKSKVPQTRAVDYFYVYDEPDINPEPNAAVLEEFIDILKSVFPKIKVTTCYAIGWPQSFEVIPPRNYDMLMIDPYFTNEIKGNTAADFERFYQTRLALALSWVNRWDKPFMLVGDSFWQNNPGGKIPPSPETSLWYYQIAMLQPRCIGLLWFEYGILTGDKSIVGLGGDVHSQKLQKMHQTIGERILGRPSRLGLPENEMPPQLMKRVKAKTSGEPKLGLYVEDGSLKKNGLSYRGIGVNYFSAFYRTIKDPNDKSYKAGFESLRRKYDIPFVRFMACGFWPVDWKLYLTDKKKYFELFDEFVAEAEKQNIGLIPSLFWYAQTVPDIVGEPMDQLGDPKSKTHEFIRTYTREVVGRYRNSPAIWAWELGNEYILAADIPLPGIGYAVTEPNLGTPAKRTESDKFWRENILPAYQTFASVVREIDPDRLICTGDALPHQSAYSMRYKKSWKTGDTRRQWVKMLLEDTPAPYDCISIHIYPSHNESYFEDKVSVSEIVAICNRTAIEAHKPLFVGEFGASKIGGKDKEKKEFFQLLNAVKEHNVPLAAVWVYDFSDQNADWNITADNDRAYMLDAIKKANGDLRK
jgi:hypothetical protein